VSLITRSAILAAFVFVACALPRYPPVSQAQTKTPFSSSWTGANLVAVMPDRAGVGGWVLPADAAWFAAGFSGNLLVIEQRWQMIRGASVDAACNVTPPAGETAELMPLDQIEGPRSHLGFFDGAGARDVPLSTSLSFDGKPQVNLRAVLLAHSDPLDEPIVVHVQLVAF
jgi:hypothetical protein